MKMHLNLATRDLDASVTFYSTLLSAKPVKHYDDYALFLTEQPGLELAIVADPATNVGESTHYGIVVETPEKVDEAIARWQAANVEIEIETEETCCYATQNKVWATDPDGRRWETYYVVAETEERGDVGSSETPCCTTTEAVSDAQLLEPASH